MNHKSVQVITAGPNEGIILRVNTSVFQNDNAYLSLECSAVVFCIAEIHCPTNLKPDVTQIPRSFTWLTGYTTKGHFRVQF